jgi:hypothetical protein
MNRVPGGSGARRPRATEALRSTRTSSSPVVALRRGAPSAAMSVKRRRPGDMVGRPRRARVSGLVGASVGGVCGIWEFFWQGFTGLGVVVKEALLCVGKCFR